MHYNCVPFCVHRFISRQSQSTHQPCSSTGIFPPQLTKVKMFPCSLQSSLKSQHHPFRLPLYLVFLAVSLLFLVVNLVCALLVKMTAADVKTIVLVRVTINDSLFVLCAVSLSICLYKVAKMSLANIYLESKVLFPTSEKDSQANPDTVLHDHKYQLFVQGTSVCQVTLIGIMVVLLYASRACYNLVVLALADIENINSFDYDWYNVSDQVGLLLHVHVNVTS